ncbi:hypothetical protein M569_03431 [Genlisea aurea]|uniref:FAR1 domain-containing protein n=1 Tax=Genlisea aurea TaxID=192259 RepID=S8CWV7_9LAMI|nr:hypothetical protein M569_03431 [Genlisea aurea]
MEGNSDEDGAVHPRSGGEVVDVNSGHDEAHIADSERRLWEQAVYSEEEAYMLYCDYAQALGFNVRRGKQYYFMGTKKLRSKIYCCSKEGVKDDKPDSTTPASAATASYKRPETRTGCKAMICFSCDDNGLWKVSRFVKDHNHEMAPSYGRPLPKSGQAILAASVHGMQGEGDKIRELSLQLAVAKRRAERFERQAASYKRQLKSIIHKMEEHNDWLSMKIQKVVKGFDQL